MRVRGRALERERERERSSSLESKIKKERVIERGNLRERD